MRIKKFISIALSDLNDEKGGDGKFETLCKHLVNQVIDKSFLGSSGLDARGDGGIDGWGEAENGKKRKYAFSINKKCKAKINSEIKKWNKKKYDEMVYFSNQPIPQRIKESYTEPNLTIYDKEDLIKYIEDNPHLGRHIGLPLIKREFEKGLIWDNHQLKEEEKDLALLLPRSLAVIKVEENQISSVSPLDIIIKEQITIIEAPAGYGKSSVLKRVYFSILQLDILPIPILINLKDYIPGGLSEQLNRALPFEASDLIKNYILLLDGYDEIIDENRTSLIKEINQCILTPDVSRRYVIAVRSDQYSSSDFKSLDVEPQFTFLRGLNSCDINELMNRYDIEAIQDLKSHRFFVENYHNVFYAVKLIEYFKMNNAFADNIVDLMEYVVSNEIDNKFKNEKPSKATLENLATYMTLHQIQGLSKEKITSLGIKDFPQSIKTFTFSHKNIQEYLAASKIAMQSTVEIRKLIAHGTKVISYLKNMYGYILNILCKSKYSKFEELVNWSLSENSEELILIESDKILPDLNSMIFKKILDVESNSSNFGGINDRLISFMIRSYKNIELLIGRLFSDKETESSNNNDYYMLLLQGLIYYEWDKSKNKILEPEENDRIINFFFSLLRCGKDKKKIGKLFYCVRYMSCLSDLKSDQISEIISKTVPLSDLEGVFDNLCITIINSGYNLSFDDYRILLNVALKYMDHCTGGFSAIPDEVDDNFQMPILRYISVHHFPELTATYLHTNPDTFWLIIREINKIQTKNNRFGNNIENFYKSLFDLASSIDLFKTHGIELEILLDFLLLQDGVGYLDYVGYWLEKILNIYSLNDKDFWTIVTKVITTEPSKYFLCRELPSVIYKRIQNHEDFQIIRNYFEKTTNAKETDFYNCFKLELPPDHPLFNDILHDLTDSEIGKIYGKIQDQGQEKYKKDQELLKKKSFEDTMVLFDQELLEKAFFFIFDYLGKDEINRECLIEHHFFNKNLEINNFASQYLAIILNDNNTIKKLEIPRQVDHIFDIHWGFHFAQYTSRYNIDLSTFNESRKASIFKWIKSTLEKHPIKNAGDCKHSTQNGICLVQHAICCLLNVITECIEIPSELLLGASLSGFPRVIEGGFIYNYESFSIDYLECQIDRKKIIEYLLEKFNPQEASEKQATVFCGYLSKVTKALLPFQPDIIKRHLILYVDTHMDSRYDLSVRELMSLSGVEIEDLSEDEIIRCLYLEDGKLKYNYASSFFLREIPENENLNSTILIKVLMKAFENSSGMLKVKLAEAIISREHSSGSVFKFYAEYILKSDENKITSPFALSRLGVDLSTSDIQHLPYVEDLYIYAIMQPFFCKLV